MEKSLKSSAVNYGLYLGIVLAALTVIGYAIDLSLFTKWWFGIFILLLVIVFGIISSMNTRKLSGGFISFKEAFTSYFVTILIGILINSVVSIVIFNFVDPDSAIALQDMIIENQAQMLERFGTTQEAIDQAVAQIREGGSMYSIGNIAKSIAVQLVGFSIVGLIVALVVRKNDPNAA
ncbi:MAG: DUF4199 domain-containing protein [Winogradskyella sp.]|uniref:DUF4199 domain-containing protein n=1 Tax=Winogradskyella sp. TaxID=1883156 RepID=UPI0017FB8A77|nr:DUF4199 domain-containing protein [Winogradskyella sp.]MBT8244569.1 DUF4199 domain-containing protein [Winogradskyella sp.]NNK21860.1 DUF4199 domain-containing protein [Winogradskyella sp.]